MNNEQLREEFWNFCDNDESGLEKLSRKGTDAIADFFLTHHAKEMESLRERIKDLITLDYKDSVKKLHNPAVISIAERQIKWAEGYNEALDDVLAIMREEI